MSKSWYHDDPYTTGSTYPANRAFIGVAEEERSQMVGRHYIKASVSPNFTRDSVEAMKDKRRTDILQHLESDANNYEHGIGLDLVFTENRIYDGFKNFIASKNKNLEIVKVLNSNKIRANRTVLEVKLPGFDEPMALKCIDCELTMPESDTPVVESLAQHEIKMFDELPDSIRSFFVQKYAHGRIWFGSTSYEVILMESMYPIDVDQACLKVEYNKNNSEQLAWVSQAFKLLKSIHDAGFSHGDAHLGNILWTKGIGQGDMKFINLERMINLNQRAPVIDNAGKAIRKLGDIGFLLFCNNFIHQGIFRGVVNIDVETLHQRLRKIQDKKPSSILFLDDTLPFSQKYFGYGTWHLSYSKNQWKNQNDAQYSKISNSDTGNKIDAFVHGMTDPTYCAKVFIYLISEINKTHEETSSTPIGLDESDTEFPINPHQAYSSQNNAQPNSWNAYVPNTQEQSQDIMNKIQRMRDRRDTTSMSQNTAYVDLQLKYRGNFMFIPSTDKRVNFAVFLRRFRDGRVSLLALAGDTPQEIDTSQIYVLYLQQVAGGPVADAHMHFKYDSSDGLIQIFKEDSSNPSATGSLFQKVRDQGNGDYNMVVWEDTTKVVSQYDSPNLHPNYALSTNALGQYYAYPFTSRYA